MTLLYWRTTSERRCRSPCQHMQLAFQLWTRKQCRQCKRLRPKLKSNCVVCRECEAQEDLCKSRDDWVELVQTNAINSNINVFAFAFVITFCVVVTTLDLVLLKFLIFWHRFRGFLAPRIDAWIQDGIFQLQRRAYEGCSQGIWKRLDKEVPVTTDNVDLMPFGLESKPFCNCTPSSLTKENTLCTTATVTSEHSIKSMSK